VKIGVPRETKAGETRVALIPGHVKTLTAKGFDVSVQEGAGESASFADEGYANAGATLVPSAAEVYRVSDIILKVQPPAAAPEDERTGLKRGSMYVGFLSLFQDRSILDAFKAHSITAFAMEFVPRITRAQSMDALSSMATIAGYKAVLLAADRLPKIFPLMMTAAGTIPPSTVLVLGAGVAGLQAIATAKRLGAKVEAFDPRPAVKEQVMSLGAQFIEMELDENVETAGGYAKMPSDEFLRKEQEAIGARLGKTDVVITTAQIFGKPSPVLITERMVSQLKPGSVIVDIAAEQGGNCELTRPGEEVRHGDVTVIGAVNLPATIPVHASQMYSKNITNLLLHLLAARDHALDFQDEITRGACITHRGELVNEYLRTSLSSGGA